MTTTRVRRGHWWELTPPEEPPAPDHPQVAVTHDGRTVDVDEDIAPLVLALWAAGISTVASCQGDGDQAYIAFASPDDRRRFAEQVFHLEHLARWEWSIDHEVEGHAESVHFPAADIDELTRLFSPGTQNAPGAVPGASG